MSKLCVLNNSHEVFSYESPLYCRLYSQTINIEISINKYINGTDSIRIIIICQNFDVLNFFYNWTEFIGTLLLLIYLF